MPFSYLQCSLGWRATCGAQLTHTSLFLPGRQRGLGRGFRALAEASVLIQASIDPSLTSPPSSARWDDRPCPALPCLVGPSWELNEARVLHLGDSRYWSHLAIMVAGGGGGGGWPKAQPAARPVMRTGRTTMIATAALSVIA